jgi:2-keto-3-deoxy-L-rhamnonate aldolase RhmA
MNTNRIKRLYEQGKPAFGTYITLQTTAIAEIAGSVGLDFVRVDAYKQHFNPETIDAMVRTLYGFDTTPWVRCRLDSWEIGLALDAGAQVISTKVSTVDEARAAVAAVRYPPKGMKESSRPKRFYGVSDTEYQRWAESEVLLSFQLESPGAWENYKEIVQVEGVDIIQFGKHGISAALGVPNELSGYGKEAAPKLLEAEKAVVQATLDAGKQACLMDSATPFGLERLLRWVERGVLVIGIDSDYSVLARGYGEALKTLRRV